MAEDWEFMKGFDGYQGGPNVVASSSRLPFSSLGPPTLPTEATVNPSPGNSRGESSGGPRYSCSSRLTSPPPTPSNSLDVEGGRHSYLPPVAPSRPPQPPQPSHTYTNLTCLDNGKVDSCEGGGGQEERMEEMSMRGGRRERMTTREEMMEVKLRLGKDEKRAREGGIMLDVKDIIALPMDEFNDLIGKQGYSEEQLNMCRDIRKRGKNKMAAQNCRKRKLGQIDELAERLTAARRTQDMIRQEHSKLLSEYSSEEQKLRELSERVLRFERKDPSQWIVQVTADDAVHIRHKSEVPEHERFPPALEKRQATFHRLIGSDWQDPTTAH